MSDSSKHKGKTLKSDMATESSPNKSQVIRLNTDHSERVAILADRFGVTQAQIMRWALDALFLRVDACGGRIILPLVFSPEDEVEVSPLRSLDKDESAND